MSNVMCFIITVAAVVAALAPLEIAGLNYLLKKTKNEKLKKFLTFAKQGVQLAEKSIGPGKGQEKKAEVENYLLARLTAMGVKANPQDIDWLIEEAVQWLNSQPQQPAVNVSVPTSTVINNPGTTEASQETTRSDASNWAYSALGDHRDDSLPDAENQPKGQGGV